MHHTDLLIAATDSDEKNLLCCVMAKRSDRYCRTVACVRNPIYNTEISYLRRELGMALIINPELIAAGEIARKFQYPNTVHVDTFTRGRIELLHLNIEKGSPLIGQQVGNLHTQKKSHVLVCAVSRRHRMVIPGPEYVLEENDEIIISANPKDAALFFKKMGIIEHPLKSAMIVGGGTVGFYLAKRLTEVGVRTKIIESDTDRCMMLNEEIKKAIVIHGDGTDESLLYEEELETTEAFVPLTGMDEENIILTLHAKQVSSAKVVTKVNRFSFKDVIRSLDLGSVIYPRYLTAEAIIAYARARRESLASNKIVTLSQLYDQQVECIEFLIDESSAAITGTPIRDLHLKPDLMISFISRRGKVLFPLGSDVIEVGDSVMIVTTHKGFSDILDILAR